MHEDPRFEMSVAYSGSNPRQQTSTTQGYKCWSHGMTNVSILEVNRLKNSSKLAVSVLINFSTKLEFVSVNALHISHTLIKIMYSHFCVCNRFITLKKYNIFKTV